MQQFEAVMANSSHGNRGCACLCTVAMMQQTMTQISPAFLLDNWRNYFSLTRTLRQNRRNTTTAQKRHNGVEIIIQVCAGDRCTCKCRWSVIIIFAVDIVLCTPTVTTLVSQPGKGNGSSPTSARADSARPTQRCVLFDGHTAHNTFGDRCFATAGPHLWNSLPSELRQCDTRRVQTVAKDTPVRGPRRFVTFLVDSAV